MIYLRLIFLVKVFWYLLSIPFRIIMTILSPFFALSMLADYDDVTYWEILIEGLELIWGFDEGIF